MWGLLLVPLMAALFVIGAATGLLWFFVGPKQKRPNLIVVVAVPFVCAAAPVLGLIAVSLLVSAFQKSDLQLYQEIFGTGTTVPEQSMLFDEFGRGRSREIYMRIYPDGAESEFLRNLPGSTASEITLEQFVSRGDAHGFTWWISSNPDRPGYCASARILEADGFRRWRELRIAECLDAGQDSLTTSDLGEIYVIARYRSE